MAAELFTKETMTIIKSILVARAKNGAIVEEIAGKNEPSPVSPIKKILTSLFFCSLSFVLFFFFPSFL